MHNTPWTAERVKALRARLGMTQQDLADRLGCRAMTVSEWERELRTPSPVLAKLLDKLDKKAR